LKLTSDDETLAENKVLILYVLEKANKALTNDVLYKIVLAAVNMNYFYFQQFLLDLINVGYIFSFQKEEQTLYSITDSGKRTLDLTLDLLPGIIKLQADTNLKPILDSSEEEQSIVAEYTPLNENHYTIICKVVDNNETVFEIKTFAGSREQAKEIVDNWQTNADDIYPKILSILTNKNIS
jgi:predicted transcriptional regulator